MKRFAFIVALCLLLGGCGIKNDELTKALELRNQIASGNGCEFSLAITADYGSAVYCFEMDCAADQLGNISFVVTKPESISGITGTLSNAGGALRFDDQSLGFPLLIEGQLSPVSLPWIFLKSLTGGYVRGAGKDGDHIQVCIDDSYEGEPLQMELLLDQDGHPIQCQLLWDGLRILSADVRNFVVM